MRKHLTNKGWVLATVLALALFAAACGGQAQASVDAGAVSCADVESVLDGARSDLDASEDALRDARGPDEANARRQYEEAKATVYALESRASECANSADTTTTAPAPDCEFEVNLDPNEGNRVISAGLITPDTEEIRQQVLDLNRRDPNALFLYYNAGPLQVNPLTSVQELVEGPVQNGSCYSEKGIQSYNEWAVLWKVAILTPVDAMPEGWLNTGVSDSGPTVGVSPTGDTSGVIATFPNSDKQHGVMKRCGNPVVASPPPHVPEGPTDEPPPDQPDQPDKPQQPKCPPPEGVPARFWDPIRCEKINSDFEYQQNESPARQHPQDNSTSGVNTGPTPGAPSTPHVPQPGPQPQPGTPAPNPTPGGYDSGTPDGSRTPGGSTCNAGTCQGGGPTPPPPGPPVTTPETGQDHHGDPGGF